MHEGCVFYSSKKLRYNFFQKQNSESYDLGNRIGIIVEMSFLKELEAKKKTLKKTCLPDQKKFETMIVCDDHDYNRLMKETYFEEYYSSIEEFTFKSVITPLNLQEINDLKKSYTCFMSDQIPIDLSSIEAKIEDGISEIRKKTGTNCQVFVRLSSRSPKDAIYHLEAFKDLYQKKLYA